MVIFLVVKVNIVVVLIEAELLEGSQDVLGLNGAAILFRCLVKRLRGHKEDKLGQELLHCLHTHLRYLRHFRPGGLRHAVWIWESMSLCAHGRRQTGVIINMLCSFLS